MTGKGYNIKWKKQGECFKGALSNYLNKQILCDVTLTSEGKFFKAHQIVLAGCSKYFEDIFLEIPPNSYPVVILKDVTALEIKLLLTCIYKGDVDIPYDIMKTFLHTCEVLKMEGFYTDVDENHENVTSNGEVVHPPQNSAEVENRNKDIVDLLNTIEETIAESQIEYQKMKQMSVLDSPPGDSQKSFVFSLDESASVLRTTAHLSSEAVIIEGNQAEVMEISDDEGSNEELQPTLEQNTVEENTNDNIQQVSKPNTEKNSPLEQVTMEENTNENIQPVSKPNTEKNCDESEELSYHSLNDNLSLRLSPSSVGSSYISDDDSEIVLTRKSLPQIKMDAIRRAKRMKVILDNTVCSDLFE
ncbi:sex determination protein fruitless-like [Sitophilus oryzae]|uniref:Sex determination protein fruitless-like n=1 Tax=Sitophilus oryzae TaxID=7048 RepID=A0A6J2X6S5_SITOR|nr:sex determination protein fruitless-like [Sitophilus oryzae]XP_030746923.1 sex determination protein fruitless-like [Sitophilus oryzae]